PERVVPAIVEFVDIAGLVAGASKGEGLGNQFLAHIRETDAIINVVRCFDDENVVHVAGRVDPIADIEVIQTELCLADLATVEKSLQRYTKVAKAGNDKEAQRLVDVLLKCQAALDQARPVRSIAFSKEEQAVLKPLCLITPKPAGVIHTDFERGFIRAQTIAFDDFVKFKGEQGAKDAGKMRAEGKEYVVKDGDVMNSLFNV